MSLVSGSTYQAVIGPFVDGAVVEYYIKAVDSSPNHNIIENKNSGSYYSFTVIEQETEKGPYAFVFTLFAVFSLVSLVRKKQN